MEYADGGRATLRRLSNGAGRRWRNMDAYEVLYTTRAMRRLKPDPIPMDAQARILDAAIRSPSGGNAQNWRFLLVDDPEIKRTLGPIYRERVDWLMSGPYAKRLEASRESPDDPEAAATLRMFRAVRYQGDHWEDTPLFLFAYAQGDGSGSSIYPAVWSAMLAARAEGIGSTLTTVLGSKPEVDRLLGSTGRSRLEADGLRADGISARSFRRAAAQSGQRRRGPQRVGWPPGIRRQRAALASPLTPAVTRRSTHALAPHGSECVGLRITRMVLPPEHRETILDGIPGAYQPERDGPIAPVSERCARSDDALRPSASPAERATQQPLPTALLRECRSGQTPR